MIPTPVPAFCDPTPPHQPDKLTERRSPASTPQTDPIVEVPIEIHQALVPRRAVRFSVGPIEPVGAHLKTRQPRRAGRPRRRTTPPRPRPYPTPWPPSGPARMKRTLRQNAGTLAASVREPTSTQR
jgi:hypothetical protein